MTTSTSLRVLDLPPGSHIPLLADPTIDWVTVHEAARRAGRHANAIRRWVADGYLTAIKGRASHKIAWWVDGSDEALTTAKRRVTEHEQLAREQRRNPDGPAIREEYSFFRSWGMTPHRTIERLAIAYNLHTRTIERLLNATNESPHP